MTRNTKVLKTMAFNPSVVALNADTAKTYLAANYENNRPVNRAAVRFLANEMSAGRFRPEVAVLGLSTLEYADGAMALWNGQHTCLAVIESGVSFDITANTVVCASPKDLIDLYTYADGNKPRTFADAVRAYDLAENLDLKPTHISQIASAINHGTSGFGAENGYGPNDFNRWPIESLALWVSNTAKPFKEIQSALHGINGEIYRVFRKASVMSVALVTCHYCDNALEEFWVPLFNNISTGRNDPIGRIGAYAIKHCTNDRMNKQMPAHALSRAFAKAWNHWYMSKGLTSVNVSDKDRGPIILKGTPFDGKQSKWCFPLVNIKDAL